MPFRRAVLASPALQEMIVRYNDALLGQVQVTAACNALHPIQKRLARWILQTRDRIDSDTVPLTQELLSEMLWHTSELHQSEIARRLADDRTDPLQPRIDRDHQPAWIRGQRPANVTVSSGDNPPGCGVDTGRVTVCRTRVP